MGQQQFEEWIKKEQPQITDTQRYPRTITTISNHLKEQGIEGHDLYLTHDVEVASKLRGIYFSIDKYYSLNDRGNNMYSRAFDLYIKYLEDTNIIDSIFCMRPTKMVLFTNLTNGTIPIYCIK